MGTLKYAKNNYTRIIPLTECRNSDLIEKFGIVTVSDKFILFRHVIGELIKMEFYAKRISIAANADTLRYATLILSLKQNEKKCKAFYNMLASTSFKLIKKKHNLVEANEIWTNMLADFKDNLALRLIKEDYIWAKSGKFPGGQLLKVHGANKINHRYSIECAGPHVLWAVAPLGSLGSWSAGFCLCRTPYEYNQFKGFP